MWPAPSETHISFAQPTSAPAHPGAPARLPASLRPCAYTLGNADDQIYAMLDAGNQLRTVGATNMNAQSSRSHAIFRIILESSPKEGVRVSRTGWNNPQRQSHITGPPGGNGRRKVSNWVASVSISTVAC